MAPHKQTIEEIEYAIMSGEYRPKQRLTHAELVERLSVSRAEVRQCLMILEDRGLVRPENKGVSVVDFSAKQVSDLYLLRLYLEALAAEQAFDRLTEKDVAAMADLQRRLREHTQIDKDLVKMHEGFHQIAFSASGNDLLCNEIRRLIALAGPARYLAYTHPQLRVKALDQHDQMLKALRRGDKAGFVSLSRAHLLVSIKEYLHIFHPQEAPRILEEFE